MVAVVKTPLSSLETTKIHDWATSPEAALARRVVAHAMAELHSQLSKDAVAAVEENRSNEILEAATKIHDYEKFIEILNWLKKPDDNLYTVQLNIIEE